MAQVELLADVASEVEDLRGQYPAAWLGFRPTDPASVRQRQQCALRGGFGDIQAAGELADPQGLAGPDRLESPQAGIR